MRRRRGEIAGFDRVIVETSGLADPGPVAQTLYADHALARDFKLGPIVTVVDVFDVQSRKVSADIARAQIAAADVVVLSKVDRASDFSRIESEIRALNPAVECIRCAVRRSWTRRPSWKRSRQPNASSARRRTAARSTASR